MKRFLLLFSLLFFSLLSPLLAQKTIIYKDSIRLEYTIVNGAREGEYRSYYKNDTLCESGNYLGGSREGTWIRQTKLGKLRMKNNYKSDYVFLSEGYDNMYRDSKPYKYREIYFKEGIYKTDLEALLSRIDTFIDRNNRHAGDVYDEYKSKNVYKNAEWYFYNRYDILKWGNKIDSTIMNWIGISADHVTIRRFDDLNETRDSIVFENKRELYRERRTYYSRKVNMLFEKQVYLNGVIQKKFEYLYSDDHYKLSLYTDGKLESSGEIKDGKKHGKWEIYDKSGNVVKIVDY